MTIGPLFDSQRYRGSMPIAEDTRLFFITLLGVLLFLLVIPLSVPVLRDIRHDHEQVARLKRRLLTEGSLQSDRLRPILGEASFHFTEGNTSKYGYLLRSTDGERINLVVVTVSPDSVVTDVRSMPAPVGVASPRDMRQPRGASVD